MLNSIKIFVDKLLKETKVCTIQEWFLWTSSPFYHNRSKDGAIAEKR